MILCAVNNSTLVTSQQVYDMSLLWDYQARHHVAPAWGVWPPQVTYLKAASDAPAGSIVVAVLDNSDQAGDLGYHSEGPGGVQFARVFAEPVLQNGGNVFTNQLSVCSVGSHEVIEAILDPACNRWADAGGGTAIAIEGGDPVESDSYEITVGSGPGAVTGTVSNFVLPRWFDPEAPAGSQFDWMSLTSSPFEVRPTGYVITMSEGNVSQQFGDQYPGWRRSIKDTNLSRTYRRLRQGNEHGLHSR